MARRPRTEEIHIHIRGHAPESRPMFAWEVEDLVHSILNRSFREASAMGAGPAQTRVHLALKLDPIEHVTNFSSHPMGEALQEIAKSRTRGVSLGRLQKKRHPGWILEYIASQINGDENDMVEMEKSLSRHLLSQKE